MTDARHLHPDRPRQHHHHGRRQGQRLLHPDAAGAPRGVRPGRARRDRRPARTDGPAASRPGFDLEVARPARPRTSSTLLRLGRHVGRAHPLLPRAGRRRLHGPRASRPAPSSSWRPTSASAPTGPFQLGLNEVRIGLTLPWFAIVLARHRLTPAHFDRAAVTGTMFDPQSAREAGLLDAVVAADELDAAALGAPPRTWPRSTGAAHAATKLRVRKPVLDRAPPAIDDRARLIGRR